MRFAPFLKVHPDTHVNNFNSQNMGKVIFADNILKRKGIEKKSFNTGELNDLVEKFFMENPPEAKILLRSMRFVEMTDPPKDSDIINWLDTDIFQKRIEDPNDPFDYSCFLTLRNYDMLMPTLVINEPFFGNAAAYLRTICGFTVKSRIRNRHKQYIVSLPI